MADDKKETQQNTDKTKETKTAPAKGGMFIWLIMGAVVIAGATGGFSLSQLVGGTRPADTEATAQHGEEPKAKKEGESKAKKEAESKGHGSKTKEKSSKSGAEGDGQKPWVYEKMDSIVANLDEPGVMRYVRVSITLEMSSKLDPIEGEEFLNGKKIILQDCMTTYLAGLNLEDVRGSKSLNRIKREIQDQFNQVLFGQEQPMIERVLFKEFAVQ